MSRYVHSVAGLVLLFSLVAPIAAAEDNGQTVWIPMTERSFFGSKEIRLEATLYAPAGTGPFPVVVFSHGSTGPGIIPVDQTEAPWGFGEYLNAKGIALLAPMRRGRGRSEGDYEEGYTCSFKRVRDGIEYASESLDATFDFLKTQEWADMDRVILAGHSRGGILSTIYAAEHPRLAKGVVNFSGGWVGDGCKEHTGLDMNVTLFEEAGASSSVPHLFLYGSNDSFYSDASIEGFAKAFGAEGGDVEFELLPVSYRANGHLLFYDFWTVWMPYADDFLERVGMVPE